MRHTLPTDKNGGFAIASESGNGLSVLRQSRWYDLSQPSSFYFYASLPALDVIAALAVLAGVLSAFNASRIPSLTEFLSLRVTLKNVALLCIFVWIWTAISFYGRNTWARHKMPLAVDLRRVYILCTVGSAPGLLFATTSVSGAFGWMEVIGFWLSSIAALGLLRIVLRASGNIFGPRLSPLRNCVIVGSGARAFALCESLAESIHVRYHVIGFVDRPGAHTHPYIAKSSLGTLDGLKDILRNRVVDELLIALPVKSCYAEIQEAIRTCEELGVRCQIPSDSFSYSIARPRVAVGHLTAVITLDVVRYDETLLVKRVIDVCVAAIGLVVLAPVLAAIALGIRWSSPGPPLFRQRRYGLNKRIFTIYKFRTMWLDAEVRQGELEERNEMSGPVFKIRKDPRVTPIGRLLRRTSLDELPQLWNVLTGSMSLVGPRPLPLRDVSRFSDAWLMRRFSVKPGLTCLWQISGRNNVGFDQWIELDLKYIDTWSLGLDLRILARTVVVVLRGAGAV